MWWPFRTKREMSREIANLRAITATYNITRLSQQEKEEALLLIASGPVNRYLVAWLDEQMRHGVYLKQDYSPESVRFLFEHVADLLNKAKVLEANKLKTSSRIKEAEKRKR